GSAFIAPQYRHIRVNGTRKQYLPHTYNKQSDQKQRKAYDMSRITDHKKSKCYHGKCCSYTPFVTDPFKNKARGNTENDIGRKGCGHNQIRHSGRNIKRFFDKGNEKGVDPNGKA